MPVLSIKGLSEQVAANFNQQRLVARLTSLFGALALALASIGLYGVTAYNVGSRTHEIGVRMALGADRAHVLSLILKGALLLISVAVRTEMLTRAIASSRELVSTMTPEQRQRYGGLMKAVTAQAASVTERSGLPAPCRGQSDRQGSDGSQAEYSLHSQGCLKTNTADALERPAVTVVGGFIQNAPPKF